MCGICGWLSLKRDIKTQIVVDMNNEAKHRGPDDEGYLFISEAYNRRLRGQDSCEDYNYDGWIGVDEKDVCQSFLCFAHRRLSVIDLSGSGHQPMVNEDGYAITYNGEIFNFIELREELIKAGYSFETLSDTEVIIKSYIEWGYDCVYHFIGMWSFAIWDSHKKTIFCSRDRLGEKPFYYYCYKDGFVFASEIKQLCMNPTIARKLNMDAFVSQIMWGLSDYSEDTLIDGIVSLESGFNMIIRLSETYDSIQETKKWRYWDIDTHKKSSINEEETFELLEDAIHLRNRSDAPVGILLSGGVDSSCITAETAYWCSHNGKNTKDIHTFTSCYKDFLAGDEKDYAAMVNEHCATSQNFIYPNTDDTYGTFEELVWFLEGNTNFGQIGAYLLLKEIAKSSTNTKVLLNGQGADETMFGYERYYAFWLRDYLKQKDIKGFAREIKRISDNSILTYKDIVKYFIYFPNISIRRLRCLCRMKEYVSNDMLHYFSNYRIPDRLLSPKDLPELLHTELKHTQLPHILRQNDRLYMAHSLESRQPFVDHRYIEAASAMREEEKIKYGYTKYPLRKHFADKLPSRVIWRKNKMGWPSPTNQWIANMDFDRINELFSNPILRPYFKIEKIRKKYMSKPTAYPVEQFMVAEIFARKFRLSI